MTDKEIRESLIDIDNIDVNVTSFEADFIESIAFKYSGPLSKRQVTIAEQIIEKYDK